MSGLFISYRREDSQGWVGHLAETIKANFEEPILFLDYESIKSGDDFVKAIKLAIDSCDLILVLIGPRWLTVMDKNGRRRLDDPNDFVRLEITAALSREICIIPILLGGASMPYSEDLPSELLPIIYHQALEISDKRWKFDCAELIKLISEKSKEVISVPTIGDRTLISVAQGLIIAEEGNIKNVIGIIGATPESKTSVEVARNAKIKGRVKNIIGVKSSNNTEDKK